MSNINPNVLLERMGLTEGELSKMQTGFNAFARSLDTAQLQSLKESTPTAQQAAKTLGPDVTPEFLEEFIRAHAPIDASVVLFNAGHP